MSAKLAEILKTALIQMWTSLVHPFIRQSVHIPTEYPSSNENTETSMTELLLEILSYYGIKEVVGDKHNPDIVAMFADIGHDYIKDDETAWCSALLNFFCKKLGYERSGKLDARSWLKLPVMVLKPQVGDIVVLWRKIPDSWEGHVGLFISWDEDSVYVLGGNQSNMLSIAPYPRERVLGFRQARKLSDIKPA